MNLKLLYIQKHRWYISHESMLDSFIGITTGILYSCFSLISNRALSEGYIPVGICSVWYLASVQCIPLVSLSSLETVSLKVNAVCCLSVFPKKFNSLFCITGWIVFSPTGYFLWPALSKLKLPQPFMFNSELFFAVSLFIFFLILSKYNQ